MLRNRYGKTLISRSWNQAWYFHNWTIIVRANYRKASTPDFQGTIL